MTTWMTDETHADNGTAPAAPDPRADHALRLLDITLSACLLALLGLPLLAALAIGRLHRQPVRGRHGAFFERLGLSLHGWRGGRGGRGSRCLAALGARHWPLLINILRGEMAFVGPRTRALEEAVPAATLAVRPGLVNPWFIRRRTAVDFGSETRADASYLASRGLRHDAGLLLRGMVVALLPAPAAAVPGRVRVGDVAFDNVDMNEAIDRLGAMLDGQQAQQVSFVNPACVNIAAAHRGYRRLLARAALVLPDGIGIKIGSDMLGTPLKQNVNGTDLFPRLCEMLQLRGASVFLLGGQPGVAEQVAAGIRLQWPGVRVAGQRHGFFSVAEEGSVAAQVRASGADILLVARGVPAQDLFIDRHLPLLGVKVAMGVGGLFDFASGRIARAPMWMRETGLEWIYRLLQEPGRMWRRYLVGNVTFLTRVCLQRLGMRPPLADVHPVARPLLGAADGTGTGAGTGSGPRVVVFATPRAAADLPVPADHPAALLPAGCQTLIEQVMDELSRAAVSEVHLVVSDRPETLRATLGDGSRWGMALHWHLVQDPGRPYEPLRTPLLQGAQRLLIGHADVCLDAAALRQLLASDGQAMHAGAEDGLEWTGWASLRPEQFPAQLQDLDRQGLMRAAAAADLPQTLCAAAAVISVASAEQLLRAPFRQVGKDVDGDVGTHAGPPVPASWIRQPWGAISPQARVHPEARLLGPVLIGPGCIVERAAEVGPGVVLSRDVTVSAGTRLAHAVVLPGSYIGAGLDLSHAVVNGARIRHLRLGVESVLASADALMLDMAATPPRRPSLAGRLLAVAVLALCWPALLLHVLLNRCAGRAPSWTRLQVVSGRHAVTHDLELEELRCARPGGNHRARAPWALLAGLLDVAAGRRCWFGARPRSRSQWYALRPDWQRLLARVPVGLLHAPAWADESALADEAGAAADAFWAVQPFGARLRTLVCALRRPA